MQISQSAQKRYQRSYEKDYNAFSRLHLEAINEEEENITCKQNPPVAKFDLDQVIKSGILEFEEEVRQMSQKKKNDEGKEEKLEER